MKMSHQLLQLLAINQLEAELRLCPGKGQGEERGDGALDMATGTVICTVTGAGRGSFIGQGAIKPGQASLG